MADPQFTNVPVSANVCEVCILAHQPDSHRMAYPDGRHAHLPEWVCIAGAVNPPYIIKRDGGCVPIECVYLSRHQSAAFETRTLRAIEKGEQNAGSD